ncbi:DUF3501 family protein [Enhydrobacter sp.]|jgi:hypothetical protein|uniref:DUF3501 family protein n=1 Tax=Enhydrobacter sp. TaxID=1894999 RepID=UPI00260BF3AF|nr:DUF3501 family protein [Enhydrobacter sp.]WIM11211.1 MAG: hypothetical protein OJF58_002168 [Enhydrobacter sp.]
MNLRKIDASAIVPLAEYGKQRGDRRKRVAEIKRDRRLEVGPFATFYFECYETMLHQVHEMLFIEKGGAEQLADELDAYNPLIPQGSELVATVMFEIDDPLRRARVLATLGGIENRAFIRVGGETIRGRPEDDQERSREDGKASSVHFIRFPFTAGQIAAFRNGTAEVVVGFDHPSYGHMAVMPAAVRKALVGDFD